MRDSDKHFLDRKLPFTKEQIDDFRSSGAISHDAFYLYDEKGIRCTAQELNEGFSASPKYRNHFAVKAAPNPRILQILKEEGMGADCSSMAELEIADFVGMKGEDIFFSSNGTGIDEYERALELGAIINFDDVSHLEIFKKHFDCLPKIGCMRFIPAKRENASDANQDIIGKVEESKFANGIDMMIDGYRYMQEQGVKRFGIHMMIASNERETEAFTETANEAKRVKERLAQELGITDLEFINIGGGIGIPYEPDKPGLTAHKVAKTIQDVLGTDQRILTENGRFATGSHGYMLAPVRYIEKKQYRDFLKLGAATTQHMRTAIYGAYHHISLLGKGDAGECKYDIAGTLCEGNDIFGRERLLPQAEVGDMVVLYSSGAHCSAMASGYNGKPRLPEYLLKTDGSVELIREAETLKHLFATLPSHLKPACCDLTLSDLIARNDY